MHILFILLGQLTKDSELTSMFPQPIAQKYFSWAQQ